MSRTRHGGEPIGAGDVLRRLPGGQIEIDSPFEKEGWVVRRAGELRRRPFPGTAIRFEDHFYEVLEARVDEDDRYLYLLAPWNTAYPLRRILDYGPEAARAAAAERSQRRRHESQSNLLRLLAPLLGLLPAQDQLRLEVEYGTSATRCTAISALVIFAPTFMLTLLAMAASFALVTVGRVQTLPVDLERWAPLFFYLALESAFRGIVAVKLEEPLGSLLVTLPIAAYRAVRQAMNPDQRRERERQRATASRCELLWSRAEDQVRRSKDGLEIVSLLPKPHWTAFQTAIRWDDRVWILTRRETRGEGRASRYCFWLEEAEPDRVFARGLDYDPAEVRELHHQAQVEKRRMWAETLAPLWGLLDAPTQERIRRIYGHEPLQQTENSARFMLFVGLLGAVLALYNLLAGMGGWIDLFVGVAFALLAVESRTRLHRVRSGIVLGSVLGSALRPLAHILLFY